MKSLNFNAIGRPLLVLTVLTLVLVTPLPATALNLGAGWTRSDVGLHNDGDGIYLSVGNSVPLHDSIFDLIYALDYVQKKGSQPTPFSDPVAGFAVEDAEVTLHVLEPAVFVGASVPNLSFVPRVYVGGSIGLKVKESWSDFPGEPNQNYGYKETDVIVHVGASLAVGPVLLDVRWSKSAVGQLLRDDQNLPLWNANKADDPLAAIDAPEEGFKTEVLRVGVGYSF